MPAAPHYIALELDPSSPNPMASFALLREQIGANSAFNGIHLKVAKGANAAFWQRLKQELLQLNTLREIQHFSLSLALDETPQDFSTIMDLPFWQTLGSLCLDGPLSVGCQRQLVERLNTQTNLTFLSATTAMIDSVMAKALIEKLPQSVQQCDLSWNYIDAQNNQQEEFTNFCKAVRESRLLKLGLSLGGTVECTVAGSALHNTKRMFTLTAQSTPSMLSSDLDHLIQAMNVNPYLSIDLQDDLGYVNDAHKKAALEDLAKQNKTPSLLNLTLLNLSVLLTENAIETDLVAECLPLDCIVRLPIDNSAKSSLIARKDQLRAITTSIENLATSVAKLAMS